MKWFAALVFPLALLALGVACEEEEEEAATATPSPAATAAASPETTPSPEPTLTSEASITPVEAMIPEGWERHTIANFQIDLPDSWDTFDLTEESFDAMLEELRNWNPEAASLAEEWLTPELFEFFAFDTESVGYITNLGILRQESPLPITIAALIAEIENGYTAMGVAVLGSDSDLTIGGLRAGRFTASMPSDSGQIMQVYYVVLAKPNLVFGLVFSTDQLGASEPVFEQMAESFRVLGSP